LPHFAFLQKCDRYFWQTATRQNELQVSHEFLFGTVKKKKRCKMQRFFLSASDFSGLQVSLFILSQFSTFEVVDLFAHA
jgi:hypothetical protein